MRVHTNILGREPSDASGRANCIQVFQSAPNQQVTLHTLHVCVCVLVVCVCMRVCFFVSASASQSLCLSLSLCLYVCACACACRFKGTLVLVMFERNAQEKPPSSSLPPPLKQGAPFSTIRIVVEAFFSQSLEMAQTIQLFMSMCGTTTCLPVITQT